MVVAVAGWAAVVMVVERPAAWSMEAVGTAVG
jgi:hypothetical protein